MKAGSQLTYLVAHAGHRLAALAADLQGHPPAIADQHMMTRRQPRQPHLQALIAAVDEAGDTAGHDLFRQQGPGLVRGA